jgi:hypothetical protein
MQRNCQNFKQLAMSFAEGLRGHFGFPTTEATGLPAPWGCHR